MSRISIEDFMGDTYRIRKRILVTIFSQNFINGSQKIMTDSNCDVDADYLKKMFKKVHHPETAEVILLKGHTKSDVTDYIRGLDSKSENFDYGIFIFVFLTFSSDRDEGIHFEDGEHSMQEFYDDAKKSKVMRLKPKIFLIQSDDLSFCLPEKISKGDVDEELVEKKIPQDADRLIIMSDIPQKLANTSGILGEKQPSFLIKAFGETLLENSKQEVEKRLDLLSLTPIINQKVKGYIESNWDSIGKRAKDLSVPIVTSTLTKLVRI